MAYRNTFFRWLFLYSLTFGLTYVLKLFTYLCPETGHQSAKRPGNRTQGCLETGMAVSWSRAKSKENQGNLATSREALMASRAGARDSCDL